MAKTKRSVKAKQEEISKDLQMRLAGLMGMFLVALASLQLGFVGQKTHYLFLVLFGNFTGILYFILFVLFGYLLIKAIIPKFTGPRAVGLYLLMLGILLIISVPSNTEIVGFDVLSSYISTLPLNRGGIIGSFIYSLFSMLFDYIGTMIAAVILICVGLIFVGGKEYTVYMQKQKAKKKVKKEVKIDNQTYQVKEVKQPKRKEFFTQNEVKKAPLFPEQVFEEKNIKEDTPTIDILKTNEKVGKEPKKVVPFTIIENTQPEPIEEEVPLVLPNQDDTNYQLPPLTLLKYSKKTKSNNKDSALDNAQRLTNVLQQFGVNASIQDVFIGPSITKYELVLETGTRVNKIIQLQDDIRLALATKDIRIEAPIPGKSAVGIEMPNETSSLVSFRELFHDIPNDLKSNKLVVPLGKDVSGHCVYAALNKMPHLLIAGATGSGKSVCVNTIICSILMRAKPSEVKLILIDPKKVELSNYNGIPHLLTPVVTDPKKAASVLREVVNEMERRYDVFTMHNVRNIESYNEYAKKKNDLSPDEKLEVLSYFVVILDEVADLMMVASKEVEDCIMRIAQKARAAGIHMIVATQRPSTDVITGVIKANIPSRIAFAVASSIDSRTILDSTGAERLLGKGDMLYLPMGTSSPQRVQGAFVSDEEVAKITNYVSIQQTAKYAERFEKIQNESVSSSDNDDNDEEYEDCRNYVISVQKASASLLQRQFRIGYNKAARIIDQLESDGIIGPQIGSKPREVYVRAYEEEN
ncbi:DNA translocase FtsK [Tannockella kyphosi]|uniref:DNA translocase FtsK n=1 Tax=Tannockella kyphosi TaxID=2899121 RepID=UPI002010D71B|nr:DNA translocase FtsK [Tannockella kyphosi]